MGAPVRPDLTIIPDLTIMAHLATFALAFCALALILVPAMSKPWYQGDGLPDCAPGKCPRTAEISPIKCSSDLTMYFNNGSPTNCAEGEECDAAAADAAEGNPCRPAAGGEGYERK